MSLRLIVPTASNWQRAIGARDSLLGTRDLSQVTTVFVDLRPFNFAKSINVALGSVGQDDVLLLNDDVLAFPQTLDTMLAAPYDIVGSVQHKPGDGQVIHSGGVLDKALGGPKHLNDTPREPRECPWVTFSLVLLRNRVVKALGGLDEQFKIFFNDVDYCLRAREAGLKVGCSMALASHVGGATLSGDDQLIGNVADKKRFEDKWLARSMAMGWWA